MAKHGQWLTNSEVAISEWSCRACSCKNVDGWGRRFYLTGTITWFVFRVVFPTLWEPNSSLCKNLAINFSRTPSIYADSIPPLRSFFSLRIWVQRNYKADFCGVYSVGNSFEWCRMSPFLTTHRQNCVNHLSYQVQTSRQTSAGYTTSRTAITTSSRDVHLQLKGWNRYHTSTLIVGFQLINIAPRNGTRSQSQDYSDCHGLHDDDAHLQILTVESTVDAGQI